MDAHVPALDIPPGVLLGGPCDAILAWVHSKGVAPIGAGQNVSTACFSHALDLAEVLVSMSDALNSWLLPAFAKAVSWGVCAFAFSEDIDLYYSIACADYALIVDRLLQQTAGPAPINILFGEAQSWEGWSWDQAVDMMIARAETADIDDPLLGSNDVDGRSYNFWNLKIALAREWFTTGSQRREILTLPLRQMVRMLAGFLETADRDRDVLPFRILHAIASDALRYAPSVPNPYYVAKLAWWLVSELEFCRESVEAVIAYRQGSMHPVTPAL